MNAATNTTTYTNIHSKLSTDQFQMHIYKNSRIHIEGNLRDFGFGDGFHPKYQKPTNPHTEIKTSHRLGESIC